MSLRTVVAFLAGYAVGVATSSISVERVYDPMDDELLSDEGEVDTGEDYEEQEFLEWFFREDDSSEGELG